MVTWIILALVILLPIATISNIWMVWLFPAIVFDVILLALSIKIVRPNRVMAVEFLWKYNRILRQWFHAVIPGIEWTVSQELYKRNFSVEVIWVTSDNVSAKVWLNVVYFVEDDHDDTKKWNIYKSIYSIDDPKTLMRATIDEELRWMIFHFTHKEIFWKRSEIWKDIESSLRDKLQEFGYRIDSIQVKDIYLDESVMDAMNKEVETAKLRNAAKNQAEAEKIKKVKQAEAEKESQILLWQGMAGQRMEIAKWFKEAIDNIRAADESLNAKDILNFLLDSSRIETLERIWAKSSSRLVYLNENLEWKSLNMETKLLAGSDIVWNTK